jgi:phosphatidylinositol glycan class S
VTTSNAFILPQWGGIVIANQPPDAPPSRAFSTHDLDGAFTTFRKQLLTLLGVSELPPEYVLADNVPVSDWQLDTLYRQRAAENMASSRETLLSIAKLVDQIPNMPVGPNVKGDFQVALNALEQVRTPRMYRICTA